MKSTENVQFVQDMLGNAPRGCWIAFGQGLNGSCRSFEKCTKSTADLPSTLKEERRYFVNRPQLY
jgi:hypothetical protein